MECVTSAGKRDIKPTNAQTQITKMVKMAVKEVERSSPESVIFVTKQVTRLQRVGMTTTTLTFVQNGEKCVVRTVKRALALLMEQTKMQTISESFY